MARKHIRAYEASADVAQLRPETSRPTRRARSEMEFEEATILGMLFGQFDSNLVLIENRLGVYIAARGTKVQIEGTEDAVARARDVLNGLHKRLLAGQDIDAGAVESLIAMSTEPTLEGIITA
jgi:phosphate starvation-inducible PhoH-like protein